MICNNTSTTVPCLYVVVTVMILFLTFSKKKIILDDLIYTDEGTFQGCFDGKREYKSCLYNEVIACCNMKIHKLELEKHDIM